MAREFARSHWGTPWLYPRPKMAGCEVSHRLLVNQWRIFHAAFSVFAIFKLTSCIKQNNFFSILSPNKVVPRNWKKSTSVYKAFVHTTNYVSTWAYSSGKRRGFGCLLDAVVHESGKKRHESSTDPVWSSRSFHLASLVLTKVVWAKAA